MMEQRTLILCSYHDFLHKALPLGKEMMGRGLIRSSATLGSYSSAITQTDPLGKILDLLCLSSLSFSTPTWHVGYAEGLPGVHGSRGEGRSSSPRSILLDPR